MFDLVQDFVLKKWIPSSFFCDLQIFGDLLHFLHLRCLLPRPLPLLGVNLCPPQPVLVIHGKTIMDNIEYSAAALVEVIQLYIPIDHDRNG